MKAIRSREQARSYPPKVRAAIKSAVQDIESVGGRITKVEALFLVGKLGHVVNILYLLPPYHEGGLQCGPAGIQSAPSGGYFVFAGFIPMMDIREDGKQENVELTDEMMAEIARLRDKGERVRVFSF